LRGLADLRLVLNGVVIVLAVLFLPRGLLAWRMPRTAS
jgi:branched-chain amino acid transport system permease protein